MLSSGAVAVCKHIADLQQDQVAKKTIDLRRVDTENQIADILTKPLAAPAFRKLRDMIGVAEVIAPRA
ncbi:hypothetical protein AMAG_05130 [Allomyces macrogynus ATCC 38327]|uniref:Uncharacterized protein n=1 Tax=Allomyces macrogynus (strain ATCC 38327) TaxID=578462 RepID=A0A0L0SAY7_ALLM3|nr:hypothetical protein AMAG_05130 [Allomyces macrogynus ATCC 38327]|eukprot:KNE59656.1 hypothetical protein AMAG_05130 [Allomyces macrogynus ATCC 38327]